MSIWQEITKKGLFEGAQNGRKGGKSSTPVVCRTHKNLVLIGGDDNGDSASEDKSDDETDD